MYTNRCQYKTSKDDQNLLESLEILLYQVVPKNNQLINQSISHAIVFLTSESFVTTVKVSNAWICYSSSNCTFQKSVDVSDLQEVLLVQWWTDLVHQEPPTHTKTSVHDFTSKTTNRLSVLVWLGLPLTRGSPYMSVLWQQHSHSVPTRSQTGLPVHWLIIASSHHKCAKLIHPHISSTCSLVEGNLHACCHTAKAIQSESTTIHPNRVTFCTLTVISEHTAGPQQPHGLAPPGRAFPRWY